MPTLDRNQIGSVLQLLPLPEGTQLDSLDIEQVLRLFRVKVRAAFGVWTSAFVLAKNTLDEASPWIELYEIELTSGAALYLTNHPVDVIYDGITWQPWPIRRELLESNIQGQLPQLVVHVANVTRDVEAYLEAYDGLRGKRVWLRLVNLNDLAAGEMGSVWYVDSVSANAEVASFVLVKNLAVASKVPKRVVTRELFPALPA